MADVDNPFLEAVRLLREVVAELPVTLSHLLGVARPGPAAARGGNPKDPVSQLADTTQKFNAAAQPWVRTFGMLNPALGRFAASVTAANQSFAGFAAVAAGFRRSVGAAPVGPAPWRQLAAGLAARIGNVLPAGQNLQGFATRQFSSLLTQGLQRAVGQAFQAVQGPVGQQLLTPQVANNLATRIGQFQAWTTSRQFQTNIGVNVGTSVASALARAQRFIAGNPAGAAAGAAQPGTAAGLGRALAAFGSIARLAGPVGLAVGAVVGLGHAVGRLVGDLGRYAEQVNSGNRGLAAWNANIAQAFVRLDLNSIRRERDLSRATERTTISLAESVDRMRQSWQGFDTFTANTRNRFARVGADFSAAVGNDASKLGALADRIGEFIDSRGGNTLGGRAAWAAVTGVWGVPALAGGDEGYGAGLWKLAKWSNPLLGTIFDLLANPPAPAEFTDQATAAFRFWARPNVGPFRPMDRPNMPGRNMP